MNRSLSILLVCCVLVALVTGRLVNILFFCVIASIIYTFIQHYCKAEKQKTKVEIPSVKEK